MSFGWHGHGPAPCDRRSVWSRMSEKNRQIPADPMVGVIAEDRAFRYETNEIHFSIFNNFFIFFYTVHHSFILLLANAQLRTAFQETTSCGHCGALAKATCWGASTCLSCKRVPTSRSCDSTGSRVGGRLSHDMGSRHGCHCGGLFIWRKCHVGFPEQSL